jgi:hypothetical protein
VPDIEKLSPADRSYYEDFMCTVPHNPNNVDLSKDVLFTLTTPQRSHEDAERIDQNVLPKLDEAIAILEPLKGVAPVFRDQLARIRALKCWLTTQRNIAVWVDTVYGFMNAGDQKLKDQFKAANRAMMLNEIGNSEALLRLFGEGIEFMSLTDRGETPLMYGINLPELVERRIRLMKEHLEDDPHIDHDYIEKMAGQPLF